jgi:hypothetical protein
MHHVDRVKILECLSPRPVEQVLLHRARLPGTWRDEAINDKSEFMNSFPSDLRGVGGYVVVEEVIEELLSLVHLSAPMTQPITTE